MSRAGKTLRFNNSIYRKIPYPHLMERICYISRYGRILQEFLFEFFENCCTTNKLNLLSKKVKFVWIDDCQLAFDTKLSYHSKNFLFLKSPDYEKPFKLIIDSSDVGTGAMLVQ